MTLAEQLKPDVAVIDITMPDLNGLDATRQIKRVSPETEILIFSGHETEELVHAVFNAGARSFVLKTEVAKHLVSAVQALSEHRTFFDSKISDIIFARYIKGADASKKGEPEAGRLTSREREIVQLLAEGKSNKEVAGVLGISVKTVETHRAAVMRKLGLSSASELVRYAIRNKIIEA